MLTDDRRKAIIAEFKTKQKLRKSFICDCCDKTITGLDLYANTAIKIDTNKFLCVVCVKSSYKFMTITIERK